MGRERGQINLADELEHAPTEDLIVVVLAIIVNKLLWVHIHQNWVDIVAQTGHLSFLKFIGVANWEIHRRPEHFMHIFGATVRISIYWSHQRPIV